MTVDGIVKTPLVIVPFSRYYMHIKWFEERYFGSTAAVPLKMSSPYTLRVS